MTHKYLQFEPPTLRQKIVRDVALDIFNTYTSKRVSRSKALKIGLIKTNWWLQKNGPDGKPIRTNFVSNPYCLADIERHLEGRDFDHSAFNLYELKSQWLDSSVTVAPDFHAVGGDGKALMFSIPTELGSTFPLIPTLDREGQAYNSFQGLLINRIYSLTNRLVDESDQFAKEDWFQNLRSLFSECVSVVDSTLHQLYFKAEHSPESGWTFDREMLGERHGGRLLDKFSWIFQITRKHLDARDELKALKKLKDLRNHLHHFDPPCFCFTLEEVSEWLNLSQNLAMLLWKMRIAMGAPLSRPLIKLLLMRRVVFVPKDGRRRLPMSAATGYGTTRW